MKRFKFSFPAVILAMFLAASAFLGPVRAQGMTSNTSATTLTMAVPAYLTTTCDASVNFTWASMVSGKIPADTQLHCTTAWNVASGTTLNTYLMLANGAAGALNLGTNQVPPANLLVGKAASPTNGCTFVNAGFNNYGCVGAPTTTLALTSANYLSTLSETFFLTVNTNGLSLPTGAYTGTLNYISVIS